MWSRQREAGAEPSASSPSYRPYQRVSNLERRLGQTNYPCHFKDEETEAQQGHPSQLEEEYQSSSPESRYQGLIPKPAANKPQTLTESLPCAQCWTKWIKKFTKKEKAPAWQVWEQACTLGLRALFSGWASCQQVPCLRRARAAAGLLAWRCQQGQSFRKLQLGFTATEKDTVLLYREWKLIL